MLARLNSCPTDPPQVPRSPRAGGHDRRPPGSESGRAPRSWLHVRIFPREHFRQPRPPSTGRCLVSTGGRHAQLNLRARIELTPDSQLTSHQLGAFTHATQTVVPSVAVSLKMLRVNALSVISDPQPKLPFVIPDFHFDPLRLRVLEGIAHRFSCDPVDFISEDWMEIPRGSFNLHAKLGCIRVCFTGREFLTQSINRQRKIAGHHRR